MCTHNYLFIFFSTHCLSLVSLAKEEWGSQAVPASSSVLPREFFVVLFFFYTHTHTGCVSITSRIVHLLQWINRDCDACILFLKKCLSKNEIETPFFWMSSHLTWQTGLLLVKAVRYGWIFFYKPSKRKILHSFTHQRNVNKSQRNYR